MGTKKMPVIYSQKHRRHFPKHCFYSGVLENYAEVPQRIDQIHTHLSQLPFIEMQEAVEPISEQIIAKAHDAEMIRFLRQLSQESETFLQQEFKQLNKAQHLTDENYIYPDVFPARASMRRVLESKSGRLGYYSFDNAAPIGIHTWDAMLYSATVAVRASELLLNGQYRAAYALCRPPGHHAGYDFIGGYCYLNNAAIAAHHLLETGQVAILDIDYHHGNGTQQIFWDNPNVYFGSLHAHPDFDYPYYSGHADEIGGTGAEHSTRNCPLPIGTTRTEFMPALGSLLNEIADFKPTWLVVSVGFDTFIDDGHGVFNLESADYVEIGQAIHALNLPTLYVQEGGYRIEALGQLTENLIAGALADTD